MAGVQTAITVFTLTMAALMIPGSKLTDIWGRKVCLRGGLVIYGVGALIAALAPGLGILILGYSLLEGIGTALLIPPVYILATVFSPDLNSRARAFGAISAAGGVGAAAGPLIGGLITTATSWRVSFLVQVLVVGIIFFLSRRIVDPGVQGVKPRFDTVGAVLSAAGLFFVVIGILQADTYGWFRATQDVVIGSTVVIPEGGISPLWVFVAIGALLLGGFFWHIRSMERRGREPLLHTKMFRNRVSNLGLVTQNMQWLVLLGLSFVISVYLQEVRGYNAIETGLILTPTTIGILASSMAAGRLAQRRSQATLIRAGFVVTVVGMLLLLLLARETSSVLTFVPGLLLVGLGVGVMLDLLGHRRAVQLSRGGPGGDLGPVAQRLEPGLLAGRGHCRHRHRLHSGHGECGLRPGPYRPGGVCGNRSRRRDPAARQPGARSPGARTRPRLTGGLQSNRGGFAGTLRFRSTAPSSNDGIVPIVK